MDIFSGWPDLTYGVGELYQRCDACRWWQGGHRREMVECPKCARALPAPQGLEFGGLYIERRPAGFVLHDAQERFLRLSEADVPDSLRFMAAHWKHGTFGRLGETDRVRSGTGSGDAELERRFPFLNL